MPPPVAGETMPAASPTSSTPGADHGLTKPPDGMRPARRSTMRPREKPNIGSVRARNAERLTRRPGPAAAPTCVTRGPLATQAR